MRGTTGVPGAEATELRSAQWQIEREAGWGSGARAGGLLQGRLLAGAAFVMPPGLLLAALPSLHSHPLGAVLLPVWLLRSSAEESFCLAVLCPHFASAGSDRPAVLPPLQEEGAVKDQLAQGDKEAAQIEENRVGIGAADVVFAQSRRTGWAWGRLNSSLQRQAVYAAATTLVWKIFHTTSGGHATPPFAFRLLPCTLQDRQDPDYDPNNPAEEQAGNE